LHELFPNENDFDRPEGFPSLPLETEESFADFDGHLYNKVLYNHMVSFLSLLVRQILYFICIHEVFRLIFCVIAQIPVTERKGRNNRPFYLLYFVDPN